MCTKNEMDQTENEIREIFSISQRTTAVHQKNSIILKQLYESSSHEEFLSSIENIITILLITERGSQFVEKTIKFFALFCSLLESKKTEDLEESAIHEEHPLLQDIISFLLKTSKLKEDIIRTRSCQIINTILDNLIGVEVSQQLCDDLEKHLLIRLYDPKTIVRQQAISTLYRLQDPENPEDVIIPEFIRLMNSDSFAKVRQLCIEKIAARNDVILHILKRIRDVDQNVRLAAYTRLSKFAGFLKISEKRLVLHCGFLDKSDSIKRYLSGLIRTWLDFYDNDILKFMKSIRLDADEKDIEDTVELFENILKVIFQSADINDLSSTLKLDEKKLVPHEVLNWEVVSFWRIYVQYLSERSDLEEELEKVIPELIYFCKYIKEYYMDMPKEVTSEEFLEQQFIIKQLFLITKTYDFGDVTNRKCLNALVSNALENVVLTYDVVETIVSNLEHSMPNVSQRTQYISEMISDILHPMDAEESQKRQQEQEYQKSRLAVEINRLIDQQEEAIREQRFVEAEHLKHELNTMKEQMAKTEFEQPRQAQKRSDPFTLVKCLDIAAALLMSPKVDRLTSHLQAMKEDFIHELLIHDNDTIKAKAFKCYGLYCVIDKDTSSTGIHIFYTPIFGYKNGEECDTQILLVCISAVVDILRIYGSQLMAAPENGALSESMEERQQAIFSGGTSLTDILQGLVDLMDDDEYEIQEKAGLGLCQLVLSNRIVSPSLISRLIIKWCNPASDNECTRLKQIIGFTLEKVPFLNDCSDQLIDAVLMTINALYAAPRISPLADVNVEGIAKFLMALCKMSPNANYIHSTLATRLLQEMKEKPKSKINGLFSKMLLMLDIPNEHSSTEELLNSCHHLLNHNKERIVLNNMNKIIAKLNTKALSIEQMNIKGENANEEERAQDIEKETDHGRIASTENIDLNTVKDEIEDSVVQDVIFEESENTDTDD